MSCSTAGSSPAAVRQSTASGAPARNWCRADVTATATRSAPATAPHSGTCAPEELKAEADKGDQHAETLGDIARSDCGMRARRHRLAASRADQRAVAGDRGAVRLSAGLSVLRRLDLHARPVGGPLAGHAGRAPEQ